MCHPLVTCLKLLPPEKMSHIIFNVFFEENICAFCNIHQVQTHDWLSRRYKMFPSSLPYLISESHKLSLCIFHPSSFASASYLSQIMVVWNFSGIPRPAHLPPYYNESSSFVDMIDGWYFPLSKSSRAWSKWNCLKCITAFAGLWCIYDEFCPYFNQIR